MLRKLTNWWIKRKTKDLTEIPLLVITFNYRKYKMFGAEGSCDAHVLECHDHPNLWEDEKVQKMLKELIDYIRETYDMERFTRI